MEVNGMQITPPAGYEIDDEKSTSSHIFFKEIDKNFNYNDVAKELFLNKLTYYPLAINNSIEKVNQCDPNCISDYNNCVSEAQAKWLVTINRLQNVATYLNDGWKPNWKNVDQLKYRIYYDFLYKELQYVTDNTNYESAVYFKSKETLQKAVEILGKETVKTALGVYLYS